MRAPVLSSRLAAAARQHGVGIVELMITLLLGALLTAGIISLFNANRQSFRLQDNLAVAQESGSFAVEYLTNDLRIAGYPGDIFNTIGVVDVATTVSDRVQSRNRLVNGVSTAVDFVDDQLATVFVADLRSSLTSCNGEPLVEGNYYSNVYWVQDTADGLDRELMCQGFELTISGTNITGRAALGNPEALISGVDSFQVLYGVDTTHSVDPRVSGCPATNPEFPNRYIPGSQLAAAFAIAAPAPANCYLPLRPISALRAVRVGLLVRTSADVDSLLLPGQTYTVLDRVVDATNFPLLNDGRVRRVFTTTVALRNTEMVIQ